MKWYSTNDPHHQASFAEAVDRGIAPDGGLYMPGALPLLPAAFFPTMKDLSLQELSFRVADSLLHEDVPEHDLRTIIREAITFPAPVRRLDDHRFVLELFHGPTLAFKDFGARFMARTLAYLRRNEGRELTILVATSGDTGSAVAHGFLNVEGMHVVLLYPSGRVSTIQEMQLTTIGRNVTALEVEGTFDDCQRLVKQAFADGDIRGHRKLSSANSINIARLLPQSFYYFHAFAQAAAKGAPVVFSVPSGNLGNLTAGLFARAMGLPVRRFIAATNANDVFTEYLETGTFTPKKTLATISNAMDVGNPSNFARIHALFRGDLAAIRNAIFSASFSDDLTRKAIREIFEAHGYVMDPHGAVGYLAHRAYLACHPGDVTALLLETAHPSKFLDVFEEGMKAGIVLPEHLRKALAGKKASVRIGSAFADFKSFLLDS
jgi:threonine synthase